jgi:hypothetical protein
MLDNIFNDIIINNSTYSGSLNQTGKKKLQELQIFINENLKIYFIEYYNLKKKYLIMEYKEYFKKFYILDSLYFDLNIEIKEIIKLITNFKYNSHKKISEKLIKLLKIKNNIVKMENIFYIDLELLSLKNKEIIIKDFIDKIKRKDIIIKTIINYIKIKYKNKKFMINYTLDNIPLSLKIKNKLFWNKINLDYLFTSLKI